MPVAALVQASNQPQRRLNETQSRPKFASAQRPQTGAPRSHQIHGIERVVSARHPR